MLSLFGYRSIHKPIIRRAFLHPKQEIMVDDMKRWKYIELMGGAYHLAKYIKKHCKTRTVGLMLPTSGIFPMSFLACWIAGKIPVPLNYLLSEEEQDYIIADCETDTVISVKKMLDHLGYEPKGVNVVNLDMIRDQFKGIPPFRISPLTKGDDTAVILYTSGTSGKPKGVQLTHDNILSQLRAIKSYPNIAKANCLGGVLPQFHSFGMTVLSLLPLSLGLKVAYQARFVPKQVVKMIRENEVDVFVAIPAMYNALIGVKGADVEDLKSIKLAISGGAPLPDAVFQGFKEKFNVDIYEGYGLTETSPVTNWNTLGSWRYRSVGKFLPEVSCEIRDEGKVMPVGQEGEIYLKGPNIMKGYFKLPELTAEVLGNDGFFKTGDWGKMDEDGYLYITGRVKEMLIIGGENVFPREIEEILNAQPSVAYSCVVGRPDDSRGEVPVAFIELAEDHEFDEADLRAACREALAGFKVPKEVRVVEELPRNPTGKLLRRVLMDQIKAEVAAAS